MKLLKVVISFIALVSLQIAAAQWLNVPPPVEAKNLMIFTAGVPVVASGVAQSGAAVTSSVVNDTTNTLAVTVGAGESLFVCVSWYQGGGDTITSVTWNGTENLTQVGIKVSSSLDGFSAIYAIGAPTAGSHNVVATFVNENTFSIISATKWTGCDTTTPYHNAATNADVGAGTQLATVDVASVASGEATLSAVYHQRGDEDNPGSGVTLIYGANLLGTADQFIGASGKNITSTGTVTMSWNGTTTTYWSTVACAIKKAG